MSIYLEGQEVTWVGLGKPAHGQIIAIAGRDSAHVKWNSGPQEGSITLTDLYDIAPLSVVAVQEPDEGDPMHLTAVRKVYDTDGDVGVLNFLASRDYLIGWQKIAAEVLEFAEQRIRADASMDLPEEQLSTNEFNGVVASAAMTLLRDAFATGE